MDEPSVLSTDIVRRGRLLREFRESLGVTRAEVTSRIGWRSRQHLAIYENGLKPFSEDQQERILDAIRAVAAEKGTL